MSAVFQSLNINGLKLKHRIIIPPMASRTAGNNGEVTDAMIKHYQKLTSSKLVSLIIIEHAYVNRLGKASLRSPQLSLAKSADKAGLKKLIKTIKDNDAVVFAQLNHAGSCSDVNLEQLKGPSIVKHPNDTRIPKELTLSEISNIINDFKESALLAFTLGFDGIELHGAHGFLINQFLSPLTNQRSDKYGGSLENRQRFLLEITKEIRKILPNDYPILVRLAGDDYNRKGINLTETINTAHKLVDLKISALDISGSFLGYINPNYNGPGYFQEITSALKKEISIPIILTGGITKLKEAEKLLERNCADLIGVGRKILQDHSWINESLKKD